MFGKKQGSNSSNGTEQQATAQTETRSIYHLIYRKTGEAVESRTMTATEVENANKQMGRASLYRWEAA